MIVSTVKMRVRVGGLTGEEPPMLLYSRIVARPDGKRKLFSQMVQVTNPDLLVKVRREARNGEEADVVVEQCLGGGVSSVLLDFNLVSSELYVEATAIS